MAYRIAYIDRMKGLIILIVVLAHVYLLSFGMSESWVYKFCSSFEMPLFMFISGFVAYICPTNQMPLRKLYIKFARRIISYICPAFVIGWCVVLYEVIVLENKNIESLNSLIWGAWYLKTLALFVCLQAILVRYKNIYIELGIVVLAEVLFLLGWKNSPFLYQLFCLEHCFFFYPFFMLGYYFRRYNWMENIKLKNWMFTVSLIGFFCLLGLHIENHALRFLSERIVRPSFAILVFSYLFVVREGQNSKLEHWLSLIGTKTLDIYVYHGLLIQFLFVEINAVRNVDYLRHSSILVLGIAVVLTLFLSYVSILIGFLIRKSDFLGKIVYGYFCK